MTLATRCLSCGTAFRVVHDQLKVSDGWVRCGRCAAVFNATETLFDLDAPTGVAPRAAGAQVGAGLAAPAVVADAATGDDAVPAEPPWVEPPAPPPVSVDELHASLFQRPEPSFEPPADAGERVDTPPADESDAPATEAAAAAAEAAPLVDALPGAGPVPAVEVTGATAAGTAVAPAFVRQVERAERWRSREARAALAAVAVLLAGAALLQTARGFHADIAAAWPASRGWLEPLCRVAGCADAPLRRIDSVTVESSSLVTVNGTDWTRLSLVLRNRDRSAVLLPAVELTLTDAQGNIVARKVLAAGELGADDATLAGGAEVALQTVLDTGERRVVGYSIDLFYP